MTPQNDEASFTREQLLEQILEQLHRAPKSALKFDDRATVPALKLLLEKKCERAELCEAVAHDERWVTAKILKPLAALNFLKIEHGRKVAINGAMNNAYFYFIEKPPEPPKS